MTHKIGQPLLLESSLTVQEEATFEGAATFDAGIAGDVTGDVTPVGPVAHPSFTVAGAPDATLSEGAAIYVSNEAGGNPVLAFSNGTDWLRCDTLAVIAAV